MKWKGLLAAAGAVAALGVFARVVALAPTGAGARPNLIVIVIDTLRADHVAAYGYERPTTPTIDALARDAIVFRDAMSPAPMTIPSMIQIMTGRMLGRPGPGATLAQNLSAAGYATLAVVDNPLIELRDTVLLDGFDAVFINDVIDERTRQQHYKTKTPADVITRRAIRWLDGRDPERPFFAWLHYFDPHDPYAPPHPQASPFLSKTTSIWTGDIRRNPISNPQTAATVVVGPADRQHMIDLYDSEIRYVDESLADLIAYLRDTGLYEDSLIVLTSDHGEAFGERGLWMHGRSLSQDQIHVPLLIKLPGASPPHREVAAPVRLIDLATTLCGALGTPCDAEGHSLLEPDGSQAFAAWNHWIAVREGDWKLVYHKKLGVAHLYDLASDPGEVRDVSDAHPEILARLLARKDELVERVIPPSLLDLSAKEAQRLRALGYLE